MRKGKFKKVVVIVLIVACSYYTVKIVYRPDNKENEVLKQQHKMIERLNNQVNDLKQKEQQEELRKLELKALQNPEIITKELLKVGKLISLQGTQTYGDYIREKSFWGTREVTVDLKYNFGIAIDLSKVIVADFHDDVVIIHIPKHELRLEYLELDATTSRIDGKKSWLTREFVPDEVKMIIESATDKTRNKIIGDVKIHNEAYDSLKMQLDIMIKKLGYSRAVYEII